MGMSGLQAPRSAKTKFTSIDSANQDKATKASESCPLLKDSHDFSPRTHFLNSAVIAQQSEMTSWMIHLLCSECDFTSDTIYLFLTYFFYS